MYRMVGGQWDPRTHDLRDALAVNGVPFEFHTQDSDVGRQLIQDHQVDLTRLPAVITYDGTVLQQPSMTDLAANHGIQTRPSTPTYDMVVLGAGPAGLAAAVYGASEGLDTLVVEARAIGGQAGTSSMIRNYLGFQRGISGGELAHRAWQQATLLGADFVFTNRVTALTSNDGEHVLTLEDGSQVAARAVILATGVTYRRLDTPELDRLVGAGVFYGAAGVMASAVAGEDVFVVGGPTPQARPLFTWPSTPPVSRSWCVARPSPPACRTISSGRLRPPRTSRSGSAPESWAAGVVPAWRAWLLRTDRPDRRCRQPRCS